ncbi:MAG: hypothetical protein Q8K37_02590, partial [Alphaproteobacteria bacterium]|nr:hypothetical protein [Alphaproteobacteria bacterium]
NYAYSNNYLKAIENWMKALEIINEKKDIEFEIKIYNRFVCCPEYHRNDFKRIDNYLFMITTLIEENYDVDSFGGGLKNIKEIQDIYIKAIIDRTELYQDNYCHKLALNIRLCFNQGFVDSVKDKLQYIKVNLKDMSGRGDSSEDISLNTSSSEDVEMSE